ncbi:MAG: tRNA dihydrouridine synthase DusB [Mogibacterium sp.]|nr:tRNA dihydrouridine synthase DusB [Mogibacterium sp.]
MAANGNYSIGPVVLSGPYILAPLAGITDRTMRTLCAEQGAAMTCTEMVSAKGLHYGDRTTPKLIDIGPEEGPTAIQIFGSEPDIMAEAAERLNGYPNAVLDINMGCPVPKVVRNGDGSALMKDPELVYRVVRAVASNTDKPVTVKIRKGFDEAHVNAVEVALAAESGGASAVTVHGRTREQYYRGAADWDIIRAVKQAVRIPVIGNGDIWSGADGVRMMAETGCDLVMVARGALGRPWIFRELLAADRGEPAPPAPTVREISEMMLRHFDGLLQYKGEFSAVREIRKHVAWYTKGVRGAASVRRRVNDIESVEEMREVLQLETCQQN